MRAHEPASHRVPPETSQAALSRALRCALHRRHTAIHAGAGLLAAAISVAVETASAAGFPAAFELRSLQPQAGGDGSTGFILRGIDDRDRSGSSVCGAGDVNGDGIDDLIIGAPGA